MLATFTMVRFPCAKASHHSTYYSAHVGEQIRIVALENDFRSLLLDRMDESQVLDHCEFIAAAKARNGIFDVAGMISVTLQDR